MASKLTPIERLVFEGQTLTVQVIKDAIGSKGARLSAQISIAGRMLVFLPQDKHIGISHWGAASSHTQLCGKVSGQIVNTFIKKYPATDSPEPAAA